MMRKVLTIFVSLLLALSLVSLFGCGSSRDQEGANEKKETNPISDETTASDDETNKETETDYPVLPDSVFGTKSNIVIELSGWAAFAPLDVPDIGVENMQADTLSMAAYERDRWISEYLDITMEVRSRPTIDDSVNAIRTMVQTGTSDVDLWLMRSSAYGSAITGGLLSPLDRRDLSYFNPDSDWWERASYDALSVAGTHYGVIGDFTVADDMTYWNVYFNKDIIKASGLESPYDLVKAGTWTYEKMYDLACEVIGDTDKTKLEYDDTHGISMIRDVLAGALNVSGVKIASKDSDDLPVVSFYNEDTVDIFTELCNIFYDGKVVYNCHTQGGDEIGIFTNGSTLFTLGGIYYAPLMRSTEVNFGLLPMPKFDETDDYHSATSPLFLSILVTPKNENENSDVVSAFMELYAADGSKSVVPGFYDKLLKLKVARDEESEAMLDVIFANTVYDIGAIYNFANFSFKLVDMMYTNNRNIASMWQMNEGLITADIEKMLDALTAE